MLTTRVEGLRESLDRPSGDLTVPVVIAGQGGGPEAGLARRPPCFNWWQRWDIGCLLSADPRLVLPISEEKLIFFGVCWKFKLHHAGAVVPYSSLSY